MSVALNFAESKSDASRNTRLLISAKIDFMGIHGSLVRKYLCFRGEAVVIFNHMIVRVSKKAGF